MSIEELQRRFNHHPPRNEEDAAKHSAVRARLLDLAEHVVRNIPDGRERAIVLTKLEEAMFWANAALARARSYEG